MSFYTDVIQKDPRYDSLVRCRDTALLEPVTRAVAYEIIHAAFLIGITLRISETYRSKELQEKEFEEGMSELRTVGVHHYGLAVDFFKISEGRASWAGDWTFLGRLAVARGFVWGGAWHSQDADHIQRVTLAQQPALFAGAWYPPPVAAQEPAGVLT